MMKRRSCWNRRAINETCALEGESDLQMIILDKVEVMAGSHFKGLMRSGTCL